MEEKALSRSVLRSKYGMGLNGWDNQAGGKRLKAESMGRHSSLLQPFLLCWNYLLGTILKGSLGGQRTLGSLIQRLFSVEI